MSTIVKRLARVGTLFLPCSMTSIEGNSVLHLVSEWFPRGWSVLGGVRFVLEKKKSKTKHARIMENEGPVFGNKFHGRVKDIGKQKRRIPQDSS